MAEFDAGLLASTGRAPAARRDPADGLIPRWRGRLPALGGDGRRPFRRRSAPRSSRCSSATGPAPTIRPRPRRSARPTWSTCRAASRRYLLRGRSPAARVGRALVGRARARRGPRRLLGRGDGPRRPRLRLPRSRLMPWPLRWRRGLGFVAGRVGRARTTTPGRSRCPRSSRSRRRAASVVLGIDEDTAVVGRDGAWQVHGRVAGHGLAGPPPRALPRGRDCSGSSDDAAAAAPVTPASGQSGLTVRKQSEQ